MCSEDTQLLPSPLGGLGRFAVSGLVWYRVVDHLADAVRLDREGRVLYAASRVHLGTRVPALGVVLDFAKGPQT
jgi:hypothetical protein